MRMSAPLGSEMREYVARHRKDLAARLEAETSDGTGLALGRAHAKIIDGVLMALFAAAEATEHPSLGPVALAAVGSYGRGAIALGSDADVRLVVRPARAAAAQAFAEALLYPMWDAGLTVGHQVVTIEEQLALAQTDLATATSILDMRCVMGDVELAKSLRARAEQGLFSEGELGEFAERLEDEGEKRHARFGGSVYLLEPDVKNGAGGLRDLDIARWAASARFRVDDEGDPETKSVWDKLVRNGALLPREALEIKHAEEFLWRVRNRLHAAAGRRADRLTFDAQESIGVALGYGVKDEAGAAAERFMQDYYRHARTILRAREQMLMRAVPPRRRGKPIEVDLGDGVRSFDGQASIAAEDLASDPALALRMYAACKRHDIPPSSFSREAIRRAAGDAAFCEALRASAEAAAIFVDLVCTVADLRVRSGSILNELHDVGLLLAMIPEFSPVTGRVHHDVYHVYTVDVHSIAAVDYLRAVARGDLAQERPLASRLAAEVARPRSLFLATLLHDVGKGYPDESGSRKNHSKVGADMCETILPRLGISQEDIAQVSSLVLEHLTMYHVATRRDLDDPSVVAELCTHVAGREGLRDLYLLTLVDLTTTSPTAMSSWKLKMLDELYFAADAYLAGKPREENDARVARARSLAIGNWKGDPLALSELLSGMPDRYLLSTRMGSVLQHARVALGRKRGAVEVAIVSSPEGRHDEEIAELCIVADDAPGLLARIAAAITASRLEVHAAEVYSRALVSGKKEAVDVFHVRDRADGVSGVARALPRLAQDLARLAEGSVTPEALLEGRIGARSPWRERPSPAVATEVSVDDRASPTHTIVEVFTKDRPGLLYVLSHALQKLGLTIALSKINTEGSRVADVFYVSELDGTKVSRPERVKEIRERVLAALSEGTLEKTEKKAQEESS
jgi:[protein-PII] uridylyltransferase